MRLKDVLTRAVAKLSTANVPSPRLNAETLLMFTLGSACFVVGPIPAYADAVGGTADAMTFFVGSLLFTTAGYLTYLQVVREDTPGSGIWVAAGYAAVLPTPICVVPPSPVPATHLNTGVVWPTNPAPVSTLTSAGVT